MTSTERLAGKRAVIVGAGQTLGDTIGNGRATALRFAEEGARVFLIDIKRDSAEETLALVEKNNGAGQAFGADVSDEMQCKSAIAAAVQAFGGIDILHYNVGINDSGRIEDLDLANWDKVFAVNLRGCVAMVRQVLPTMFENGGGVVTAVSSIAAVAAYPFVAYRVSKAALITFIETLAFQYAPRNIRANALIPGLLDTPMGIESLVSPALDRATVRASHDQKVPLRGKMGTAWDLANAAVFLASEEAKYISGVAVRVDGAQGLRVG